MSDPWARQIAIYETRAPRPVEEMIHPLGLHLVRIARIYDVPPKLVGLRLRRSGHRMPWAGGHL